MPHPSERVVARALLVGACADDASLLRIAEGLKAWQLVRRDRLADGLRVLSDTRMDAALVDVELPDARVLDAIHAIGARHPELPIVVLASAHDESVSLQALREGAQDYLVKGDITPRSLAQALQHAVARQPAQAALAHLAALVDAAADAIFRCAPDGTVTSWNRSAERVFGPTARQAMGGSFLSLLAAEQQAGAGLLLERLRQGGPPEEVDAHLLARDGQTRHLSISLSAIRDRCGRIVGTAAVARDVTQNRRLEAEVVALSLHDELTGLLNRRGFAALCEQQMTVARRNGRPLMLLYVDLDGLKGFNDSFGHAEGDRALAATAAILKESFRETSIIARLGGDEFAALLVDADPSSAPALLERLQRNIGRFNTSSTLRGPLAVSAGTAVTDPLAPGSLQRLWAEADAAMYAAKPRPGPEVSAPTSALPSAGMGDELEVVPAS